MAKAEKTILLLAMFSVVAAVAYWAYLFISTGSAPTFSSLWQQASGSVSGLTGSKLGYSDISGYASNAGFSGDDLNTACAIALAESSGNPNAVGDLAITPGGSIGLWQVNLKAHPEYSASELTDPQTNANAAYAIYEAAGNAFTPWSTFNSGAYQSYLQNPASTPDDGTDAQVTPSTDQGSDSDTVAQGGTPSVIGASYNGAS